MTWKDRIEQATITGKFTLEDMNMAREWSTCAVSELHGVEYHDTNGAPVDLPLGQIGLAFMRAVISQDVSEAYECYNQISRLSQISFTC